MGILFTSLNSKLIFASDNDDDGIDDKFEELNKRNIDIDIEADKIKVESTLRSGETIDEIQLEITNDSDGLRIEVSYESQKTSENLTNFELEFGIIFRKLIEFVDINGNQLYDPSVDDTIQEFNLNDFQPVKYSQISISSDTKLHYFIVNTTNGIFTAHIYFSEEFFLINHTLITPVQSKIEIELSNFPYLNSSSQLALYTSLESENNYREENETEDEVRKYSENEQGVSTEINKFTGIFKWKNNASIDGISKEIASSNIGVDDYEEDEQRIYLIYSQGIHIYHDPKVGIEGIYKFDTVVNEPWFLIIFIALLSSTSISIGYAVYHYRERIFQDHYSKLNIQKGIGHNSAKFSTKKVESLLSNKKILNQLKSLSSDTDSNIKKMELTALSEDFFKIINVFEWEEDDLVDFVREMISLTPEERKGVFNEMINKSEQQKKDRLDDSTRLYR